MYSMQRSISEQQFSSSSNKRHSEFRQNRDSCYIQKSQSLGNCTIEKKRGFKPSDRYDPAKKEFLVNLSKKIWQKESSSTAGPKSINLQKLFTPATDSDEILPKNRKLYASSAFYSPSLHPTVEDQVELARRISHSLSDISNQQSKGQSMYVNRKKRSVKWVHEGEGKADIQEYNGYSEDTKENGYESKVSSSSVYHEKVPLKLVMNPRGQVRDFSSYQNDFNTQTGLLSPDKCAELVNALQAPKGKGAELFAKRRKKAENWIVDETTAATRSPSGVPFGHPKPTSPIVPAYSDAGVHHVQLNMQQDQIIQDKYATNQRLKIVKTPWEAALETGSPANAFQEVSSLKQQQPSTFYATTQTKQHTTDRFPLQSEQKSQLYNNYSKQPSVPNSQRDLAYKPSVPQGWNAPPPMLPTENETNHQQSIKSEQHDEQYEQYEQHEQQQEQQHQHQEINSSIQIQSASEMHQTQFEATTKQHLKEFHQLKDAENFNQSDEDEIIQFLERTKLRRSDEETSLLSAEHAIKQNYINCIAKSPELMVSNARESYQKYDSTIKEFKTSILNIKQQTEQQQHHQEQKILKQTKFEGVQGMKNDVSITPGQPIVLTDGNANYNQMLALTNVQQSSSSLMSSSSSLNTTQQRFEGTIDHQQQNGMFIDVHNKQQLQLQQQHQQQQQQQQQKHAFQQNLTTIAAENQNHLNLNGNNIEKQLDDEEEEEYKKIPVKDLISSFEKQAHPVIGVKIIGKKNNYQEQIQPQQQQQYQQQQQQLLQQQYQQEQQREQKPNEFLLRDNEEQENNFTPKKTINDVSDIEEQNRESTPPLTSTKELYTPPQIPLDSYVPPSTEKYFPSSTSTYSSTSVYGPSTQTSFPKYQQETQQQQQTTYKAFPITKPAYNSYSNQNQYQQQKSSSAYGKPTASSWSPQNDAQGTKTATAFNPSPLSYDKLAKFENAEPNELYGGQNQPSVGYQASYRKKVHNVSPAPFATSSRTTTTYQTSSSNYQSPSSNSFQPVNRQSVYHSGYQPTSDETYSYAVDSHPSSSRVSSVDLSQCHNYNTAPRGWTQMHDYYRPVTFGSTKQHVEMPYTDF